MISECTFKMYIHENCVYVAHIHFYARRCAALFAVSVSVGPEGTSGQCYLPLPMTSYIPGFKVMFHEMTIPSDFILWHATVLVFNAFLHLSLILYEYWPSLWSMRERCADNLKRQLHCQVRWML